MIRRFGDRITQYKFQYWEISGAKPSPVSRVVPSSAWFPAVTGSKVRLLVQETRGGQTPSIFSLGAYNHQSPTERRPKRIGRHELELDNGSHPVFRSLCIRSCWEQPRTDAAVPPLPHC